MAIDDNPFPLLLHYWDNTTSFAFLDVDSEYLTPVQLITNNLSLTITPQQMYSLLDQFINEIDQNPSRSLFSYSTWHTFQKNPEAENDITNFTVTTLFPIIRGLEYLIPTTGYLVSMTHYALGIPSFLVMFKSPDNNLIIFRQQFLGFGIDLTSPNNLTNSFSSNLNSDDITNFLYSYLIINPTFLQVLNDTLTPAGVTIPNISQSHHYISTNYDRNNIEYSINNPIFIFNSELPQEIIPFSGIYYPLNPWAIMSFEKLTIRLQFRPFYSPIAAHFILDFQLKLSPIKWMLINENISNKNTFSNISMVELPNVFFLDPLEIPTQPTYKKFILYHEKNDVYSRLNDTSLQIIKFSYLTSFQVLEVNRTNFNIHSKLTPLIDGNEESFKSDETKKILQSNLTFQYPQQPESATFIPMTREALLFDYQFSEKSSLVPVVNRELTRTSWELLNPRYYPSLTSNDNKLIEYYLENQNSYLTEAVLASIKHFFSNQELSSNTRENILQILRETLSEQTITKIRIEKWQGTGMIHQTTSDLIYKGHPMNDDEILNNPTPPYPPSSAVPSFQVILILSSHMPLAITYIFRRKKRMHKMN